MFEDERLRAAATEALGRCGDLAAQAIECRCENGEIILTGSVSEPGWKRLAREAVGEVEGVRVVHDRIAIAWAAGR